MYFITATKLHFKLKLPLFKELFSYITQHSAKPM